MDPKIPVYTLVHKDHTKASSSNRVDVIPLSNISAPPCGPAHGTRSRPWAICSLCAPRVPCAPPALSQAILVHAAYTTITPHALSTRIAHALHSTRQAANSLSDDNKLLIRCAWVGNSAFDSAGYGSSWGPGTCA